MARRKIAKSVPKCKSTRKCKTIRKRTGAKVEDNIIEVPPELMPKKESKWKKAAKIALGLAAGAGGAALGYYGYKNRDKIAAKAKETYETGKTKVKETYETGKTKAKEYYGKGKEKSKEYYEKIKQQSKDYYGKAKSKASDIYGKSKKFAGDVYQGAKHNLSSLKDSAIERFNKWRGRGEEDIFGDSFDFKGKSYFPGRENWNPSPAIDYLTPPMGPLAIESGLSKPMAIMSGKEMDVVKELNIIKDDMNRTNTINYNNARRVMSHYINQCLARDPFSQSLFQQDSVDFILEIEEFNDTSDETSKEKKRKDIEAIIDTLISKFYQIMN